MEFLKELWGRLKTDVPSFFMKLFYFMASLTILGGSIVTFQADLPEPFNKCGTYLLLAGAVGSFVTRLPNEEKK